MPTLIYDKLEDKPLALLHTTLLPNDPSLSQTDARIHYIYVENITDVDISDKDACRALYQASSTTYTVPLEIYKQHKCKELIASTDKISSELQQSFSLLEKQSFTDQKTETLAWKQDPSTPTPVIDGIAYFRDIDRELLLNKAYTAIMFNMDVSTAIIGHQQGIEDRIRLATTLEELNAIDTTPSAFQELLAIILNPV